MHRKTFWNAKQLVAIGHQRRERHGGRRCRGNRGCHQFRRNGKEHRQHRPLTSFDKGISKVSWMLIHFLTVMTPLVFLINGLDKGDWLQSLLFAVSVAVGLTPKCCR